MNEEQPPGPWEQYLLRCAPHIPPETTVFSEKRELEHHKELTLWAMEEERKRQAAGLPRPPLFPVKPKA